MANSTNNLSIYNLGYRNHKTIYIWQTVTFFPGIVCFPKATQKESEYYDETDDEACDHQHKQHRVRVSLFTSPILISVPIFNYYKYVKNKMSFIQIFTPKNIRYMI